MVKLQKRVRILLWIILLVFLGIVNSLYFPKGPDFNDPKIRYSWMLKDIENGSEEWISEAKILSKEYPNLDPNNTRLNKVFKKMSLKRYNEYIQNWRWRSAKEMLEKYPELDPRALYIGLLADDYLDMAKNLLVKSPELDPNEIRLAQAVKKSEIENYKSNLDRLNDFYLSDDYNHDYYILEHNFKQIVNQARRELKEAPYLDPGEKKLQKAMKIARNNWYRYMLKGIRWNDDALLLLKQYPELDPCQVRFKESKDIKYAKEYEEKLAKLCSGNRYPLRESTIDDLKSIAEEYSIDPGYARLMAALEECESKQHGIRKVVWWMKNNQTDVLILSIVLVFIVIFYFIFYCNSSSKYIKKSKERSGKC